MKVSAEKDFQISALKQQQKMLNTDSVKLNVNLSEYRGAFADEEVDELESIGSEVKFDSTFVRKIIFYLYNDCDLVDVPTLRSRIKYDACQQRMSDEARQFIKNMLSIRLKSIAIQPFEYLARLDKYSIHISKALLQLIRAKSDENR